MKYVLTLDKPNCCPLSHFMSFERTRLVVQIHVVWHFMYPFPNIFNGERHLWRYFLKLLIYEVQKVPLPENHWSQPISDCNLEFTLIPNVFLQYLDDNCGWIKYVVKNSDATGTLVFCIGKDTILPTKTNFVSDKTLGVLIFIPT
jgi:hypothetical protein